MIDRPSSPFPTGAQSSYFLPHSSATGINGGNVEPTVAVANTVPRTFTLVGNNIITLTVVDNLRGGKETCPCASEAKHLQIRYYRKVS